MNLHYVNILNVINIFLGSVIFQPCVSLLYLSIPFLSFLTIKLEKTTLVFGKIFLIFFTIFFTLFKGFIWLVRLLVPTYTIRQYGLVDHSHQKFFRIPYKNFPIIVSCNFINFSSTVILNFLRSCISSWILFDIILRDDFPLLSQKSFVSKTFYWAGHFSLFFLHQQLTFKITLIFKVGFIRIFFCSAFSYFALYFFPLGLQIVLKLRMLSTLRCRDLVPLVLINLSNWEGDKPFLKVNSLNFEP